MDLRNDDSSSSLKSCDKQAKIKTWFRCKKWLCQNLLLIATFSGVVVGAIAGLILRTFSLSSDAVLIVSYPGELFMRLLKLLVLPLVVASLISGAASLDARLNGRIAARTLIYFFLTSLFNAAFGVFLAVIFEPGIGGWHVLQNATDEAESISKSNLLDSLLDLGRNLFPDNLFQAAFQQTQTVYVPNNNKVSLESINNTGPSAAMISNLELVREISYRSGTNTVGIVVFCLAFGTTIGSLGPRGKVVVEFFGAVFEASMKMVSVAMWLTPLGVASVITGKILVVADLGIVIHQLLRFIATVLFGVAFYQLIIMQLLYFVFIRKNPFRLYAKLAPATLTAFATASTAAALPVTMRCSQGILDERIARFVLPIGCNLNMDGTALFIAIAAMFIAQLNRVPLGFTEIITVWLTSTAAAMSSASVPSAALALLLMVLSSINAPVQDVSLLFAVDWFVDRFRTTNNMLGDCYCAAIVESLSQKELAAWDQNSLNQHFQERHEVEKKLLDQEFVDMESGIHMKKIQI